MKSINIINKNKKIFKSEVKVMKRKFLIGLISAVLTLGLLLSVTACGGRGSGAIVVGSTSVLPYMEVLAEKYEELYPGTVIDVQGGGSSAGITAVNSGAADIGMSSRMLKEGEDNPYKLIAKDGLAIIVHPDNPVDDLTVEEIRSIYTQEINNWKDVGGNDAKINVVTREEGSGTRDAFEELVMGDDKIAANSNTQSNNGAIKQNVAGDVNAIGYISLGAVTDEIRKIKIDSVEASPANVLNKTYGLFRPFLFVMSNEGELSPEAQQFVDFVLSEEGQRILVADGLISELEGIN